MKRLGRGLRRWIWGADRCPCVPTPPGSTLRELTSRRAWECCLVGSATGSSLPRYRAAYLPLATSAAAAAAASCLSCCVAPPTTPIDILACALSSRRSQIKHYLTAQASSNSSPWALSAHRRRMQSCRFCLSCCCCLPLVWSSSPPSPRPFIPSIAEHGLACPEHYLLHMCCQFPSHSSLPLHLAL